MAAKIKTNPKGYSCRRLRDKPYGPYRKASTINEKEVYNMASIGCTMIEMAAVLDCSVDLLERHFADTIKRGRNICKESLRRKQLEVAHTGNPTMLIWLGKHLLGQHDDRQEVVHLTDAKAMLMQQKALHDAIKAKSVDETDIDVEQKA